MVRNVESNVIFSDANEVFKIYSTGLIENQQWESFRKEVVKNIGMERYNAEKERWKKIMNSDDSKEIWSGIKWKSKDTDTNKPTSHELAEQFKKKDNGGDEELLNLNYGSRYVNELDGEISIKEINDASEKLKEGKVTADGWSAKMIKSISVTILPILHIIFNIILARSLFPGKWLESTVIAVFKNKGIRKLAKYFRPVSLVIMLFKLFDFIFC